jgi:hypothetical protein
MATKKLSLNHSTLNVESPKIFGQDLLKYRRHVPRSVCDTERDRRQHKDPMNEEELQ